MALIFLTGNSMVIELLGLTDSITDAFVLDATVTITLLDDAGAEVTGETWPLTMTFVAASDGNYRAVMDEAIVVIVGHQYTAQVTAISSGTTGFWEAPVVAERRVA